MDSKSEQALKELATQAREATMNMEREEAAEFSTVLQTGHTPSMKPV